MLRWMIIVSITLTGCNTAEKNAEDSGEKKDGLSKTYYPNGKLRAEINYKNGRKNGMATTYYENGQKRQEIEYMNNVKHGMAKMYYEEGILYMSTEYENNRKEGIRRKYRTNGQIMAEIPFSRDRPCKGLKEYLLNGKLKKMYPIIVIEETDNLMLNDTYNVRVRLSNNSDNVKFYQTVLDGDCLSHDISDLALQNRGHFEFQLHMPRGTFIMREYNFVAEHSTLLGNPYIIEKKLNLAIENR